MNSDDHTLVKQNDYQEVEADYVRHRPAIITSRYLSPYGHPYRLVLNLGPREGAVAENLTTAPARILSRDNPTTSSDVD
jgi:hypothetical protein